MISLGIFVALVTTLSAQERFPFRLDELSGTPDWQPPHSPSSPLTDPVDTVIENKNVNIIVNVDPKDVAKELWRLLQSELDKSAPTRRSMPRKGTLDELERIVTPMVKPTRRNRHPRVYDVALALDRVARSAILGGSFREPTIDDEIDLRVIVARMLLKLKIMTSTEQRMGNPGMLNLRRSQTHGGIQPSARYVRPKNPQQPPVICEL